MKSIRPHSVPQFAADETSFGGAERGKGTEKVLGARNRGVLRSILGAHRVHENPVFMRVFGGDGETQTRTGDTTIFSRGATNTTRHAEPSKKARVCWHFALPPTTAAGRAGRRATGGYPKMPGGLGRRVGSVGPNENVALRARTPHLAVYRLGVLLTRQYGGQTGPPGRGGGSGRGGWPAMGLQGGGLTMGCSCRPAYTLGYTRARSSATCGPTRTSTRPAHTGRPHLSVQPGGNRPL